MFDTLPRDLQLQVIKHFDMDTRIKCGMIGRLRVPHKIKELIQAKTQQPSKTTFEGYNFNGYNVTRYRIDLGTIPTMASYLYSLNLSINDATGDIIWRVIKWSKHSCFCEEKFEFNGSDSEGLAIYHQIDRSA
jgi:hypothetical protein